MNDNSILVKALDLGDGPLTVAVKDCIDIAGFATRSGSGGLEDAPPARAHADVVTSLLAHGAHIVGKANMHELAFGITGVNARFGTPINPRYPGRIPGGSSSGSAAAVAAGVARIAIGSDTGGSIRVPAACCGVFGIKPTFGRISRRGCQPPVSTLDCIGPLAATLADLELAMSMILPAYARAPDLTRITLGVIEAEADAPVREAVAAALGQAGATTVPVALAGLDAAYDAGLAIMAGESWQAFGHLANDPRLGEDVRQRLLRARAISPDSLAEAEQVRQHVSALVDAALEGCDALVLPTLPSLPPFLDALDADPGVVLNLTRLVRPFNLTGHPAITIPLATADHQPVGLQLVGRKGGDEALLAAARCVGAKTVSRNEGPGLSAAPVASPQATKKESA